MKDIRGETAFVTGAVLGVNCADLPIPFSGVLEDATDRCEDVANVFEAVVVKHG